MAIGGIETLLVRLANMLERDSHDVQLLCQDGVLASSFSGGVAVDLYQDWSEARAKFEARRSRKDKEHFIVSLDPISCALASWLLTGANGQNSTHVTGVFHPRAWFLEDDWLRLAINRLLLRSMADDQIFFMNEESRQHHAIWARRKFAGSTILPVGVRFHAPAPVRADDGTIRIATVGRLVDFKDFNLHIPAIARRLIDDGVAVEWDVFGTGELHDQVERAILETQTEAQVRLAGNIPYDELGKTLSRYDLFVGMGTAAVEAAMLGLPTIVAVDRGGDGTYGLIQDLPFGNIGEKMDHPPSITIGSLLERLVLEGAEFRRSVGAGSRRAALRYSMDDYAAGLLAIGADARVGPYRRAALVGLLYREATVGTTMRIFKSARQTLTRRVGSDT